MLAAQLLHDERKKIERRNKDAVCKADQCNIDLHSRKMRRKTRQV
jgi:hypothetical protein